MNELNDKKKVKMIKKKNKKIEERRERKKIEGQDLDFY